MKSVIKPPGQLTLSESCAPWLVLKSDQSESSDRFEPSCEKERTYGNGSRIFFFGHHWNLSQLECYHSWWLPHETRVLAGHFEPWRLAADLHNHEWAAWDRLNEHCKFRSGMNSEKHLSLHFVGICLVILAFMKERCSVTDCINGMTSLADHPNVSHPS